MILLKNKLKEQNYIRIAVDGKFEVKELLPIANLLKDCDDHTVKLMAVIKKIKLANVFNGLPEKIKAEILMLQKLDKIALVTDHKWLEVTGKVENVLLPNILVKEFEVSQEDEAKNWLLN